MSDKNINKIARVLCFFIVPVIAFYLMEFYDRNPFEQIRPMAHLFNIMIFEMIAWIIYFLIGIEKWSLRIILGLSMLFGLVNHYVMEFRSTPFVPWDIFSINTAFSVAGNYNYMPSVRLVVVTIIFCVMIFLVRFWIISFKSDLGLGCCQQVQSVYYWFFLVKLFRMKNFS